MHVNGAAVDASTPASAPITTPPAAGTALTLLGTASDATLWFSATSGKLYHGAAVSTLGALAHGAMFAKIGDAWAVVVV